MQNEKKIAVTVAAIAVFAVLLFSYVNSLDNGSSNAPVVKDDVVVGDYVTFRYEQGMRIETELEDTLGHFYDKYFAADLEGLTYAGEVTYVMDGKNLLCDKYGTENYFVYVTKGGICVYEESTFSTSSILTSELTHCSLDVEKGFTADNIAAGMEFIIIATAMSYSEAMEFTVESIDDGVVSFSRYTASSMEQTYGHKIVEINGDTLVLDNDLEITKKEFMEVFSKEYMYEEMVDYVEIEKIATREIKYESDFGTFDAFVDQIVGTSHDYNAYIDLFYVGDDVFLKIDVMYTSEKASTMIIFEILDSSMFI